MKLDNRIIKASFRECPISDREKFKFAHCLLPISVGQSVHEDAKFLATIKLINRSFQKITILIDDSVQWHTLKITHPKHSKESLYKLAIQEGDAWLKRNISAIQSLDIACQIMRWEQWHHHKDFKAQLQKVEDLYNTEAAYKAAINSNIQEYLERNTNRDADGFDYDHAFSCCLSYLKEECAVMTLWVEGGYDFELYPSGRNKAMAATYEYLIKSQHPNLLKSVALRFKKYPAPLTVSPENTSLMPPLVYQLIPEA